MRRPHPFQAPYTTRAVEQLERDHGATPQLDPRDPLALPKCPKTCPAIQAGRCSVSGHAIDTTHRSCRAAFPIMGALGGVRRGQYMTSNVVRISPRGGVQFSTADTVDIRSFGRVA